MKIINPKYFEYDEPTERLAKEMIKEVLDNFTEREIVMMFMCDVESMLDL